MQPSQTVLVHHCRDCQSKMLCRGKLGTSRTQTQGRGRRQEKHWIIWTWCDVIGTATMWRWLTTFHPSVKDANYMLMLLGHASTKLFFGHNGGLFVKTVKQWINMNVFHCLYISSSAKLTVVDLIVVFTFILCLCYFSNKVNFPLWWTSILKLVKK